MLDERNCLSFKRGQIGLNHCHIKKETKYTHTLQSFSSYAKNAYMEIYNDTLFTSPKLFIPIVNEWKEKLIS